MIHNDIQNQLALLIKTQAPPLLDVANSAVETPEWAPGQQLPAHVIANLGNDRFQVMVEGQTLDMSLPPNTQPGDKLELVFVSGDPRPTFTLLSDLTKALPNQSSSVNLSDASKLMTLLQASSAETKPAAGQVLAGTAPIVEGEPPPLQQFANALRDAISQSGLFYESHQAEWVVGERPLASLLLEPQAQLSPLLNQQKGAAAPPTADANRAAQANGGTQAGGTQANAQTPAASQAAAPQVKIDAAQMVITNKDAAAVLGGGDNQPQSAAFNPVHASTAPLVQSQLDMLGTHQIVWQGQAWPGQEMQWEIEEDNRRAAGAEQITTWRTRLHLNFPMLGGVTAHLALAGKGIKIDFAVEQSKSAELLRGEAPRLTQAMETSGLQVTGLTVAQNGKS